MVRIFTPVQADGNRKPLNDFHKIARSIFRGKQAGDRSGRSRHALHITVKLAFIGVDADIDLLACVHFAELCFFEIGRNPNIVDLRNHEHLVAGLHALAQFYGF